MRYRVCERGSFYGLYPAMTTRTFDSSDRNLPQSVTSSLWLAMGHGERLKDFERRLSLWMIFVKKVLIQNM